MKAIIDIAKAELKTLFYSPVAWLILIIFTFQVGITFAGIMSDQVRSYINSGSLFQATYITYSSDRGLFSAVQQYLYLYIPLLTMGVFSREFSSGSIKLLYSSPVKTRDIILGKYAALLIFCFCLLLLLSVFVVYGIVVIQHVDLGVLFAGLLGVFLLMATYSAIGLFMSSLTSYTVVSAMGTMAVFAVLTYVRNIGQETELIRDITYWLSIAGRADTFKMGMITSEDLIYFFLISGLFLVLTFIYIQSQRQPISKLKVFGKYSLILLVTCFIGYLSAKPKLKAYADLTANKRNTLMAGSQKVIKALSGPATIITYVNVFADDHYWFLPRSQKSDMERFSQYVRFKPEIKQKYIYYYAPLEESDTYNRYKDLDLTVARDSFMKINDYRFPIHSVEELEDDLASEHNKTVRLLKTADGKQSFLRFFDDMMRFPSEGEISAAFKRLTLDTLPTVGFVTGHNERSAEAINDRGYMRFAQAKSFRYALVNQGFDFEEVLLNDEIPSHVQFLMIAEPRADLSLKEIEVLKRYIDKGGNMLIAAEPGQQQYINPVLALVGLELEPGVLVQPSKEFAPDLLCMKPVDSAVNFNFYIKSMVSRKMVLPFSGAGALKILDNSDFRANVLFTSDTTQSWNELQTTNFIDDSLKMNADAGESFGPRPTVIALDRNVGEKMQKIFVTSDADWLSNQELRSSREGINSGSFNVLQSAFYWFTNEELPVDLRGIPYKDRELHILRTGWENSKIFLQWVFPLLLVLGSFIFLLRRKGK